MRPGPAPTGLATDAVHEALVAVRGVPVPITLVVGTAVLPPTRVLLAGISALSALPEVRRVVLGRTPLRYTVDVAGDVDPGALAGVLRSALHLPVHVQSP